MAIAVSRDPITTGQARGYRFPHAILRFYYYYYYLYAREKKNPRVGRKTSCARKKRSDGDKSAHGVRVCIFTRT